ncbi:hypothetical protein PTTG_25653 [Puccinia triticina 1-1 BBBD Race 1]|uniref:Secreted protein n=2 Tax=Puccinia triticina TaxID=208348 RepID=A0A180H0U8_PUCT1|nr:uncharacterized protein PtA15_9A442 [Puccinia triticina]OAV98414.1 hypothetical protein PTTG_25653 [Puccinia triticina 1-1 BBBD Race 1]WAQ88315.1 hypothetical protein PtA15_9A442 [Puccinia triticina]WAR60493.1 hypothetical protein PtB15_9B432 [Puccinia triticina]
MFPAGSIWKLSVVLAVVVLAGLPAAELADPQRHVLSRRISPQEERIVVCNKSFQTILNPADLPRGKVSCVADDIQYFCNLDSCYYDDPIRNPSIRSLIDKWRYEGCFGYSSAGKKDQNIFWAQKVAAAKFWVHQEKDRKNPRKNQENGYMVITGYDDLHGKSPHTYVCAWKSYLDHNSNLPTCGKCIPHDFKEELAPKRKYPF